MRKRHTCLLKCQELCNVGNYALTLYFQRETTAILKLLFVRSRIDFILKGIRLLLEIMYNLMYNAQTAGVKSRASFPQCSAVFSKFNGQKNIRDDPKKHDYCVFSLGVKGRSLAV